MPISLKTTARILGGPIAGLVIDGVREASKSMENAENLESLKEESLKQEIKMEFSKHQARVAQELAIAKRIENALEVEIEEYYDNSDKGEGGLNVDFKTQSGEIGMSNEGRRVSKRIYRFKGNLDTEEFVEV